MKHSTTASIPSIGIAPLRDASRDVGFNCVNGPGIPRDLIDAARAQACEFLRILDTSKARLAIVPKHRGWHARGGAKMQDDAETGLKESFLRGYRDASAATPADHELRGPNLWPELERPCSMDAGPIGIWFSEQPISLQPESSESSWVNFSTSSPCPC